MQTLKISLLLFIFFIPALVAAQPGKAALASGVTGYELSPHQDSPLVVMIHGVSGPMTVWDRNYNFIVKQGFQVLRYDLLGRGLSERVKEEYDMSLFQNQLKELLSYLKMTDRKIIFVASSMGNIIASEYIQAHPDQVRSMVMVGPAGFSMGESVSSRLSKVPYVGELMSYVFGHRIMMERNKEYFYDSRPFVDFISAYSDQLSIEGSKRAILSTMRFMPVKDYIKGYENLAEFKIPTLLIWGRNDVSFDFKFSNQLRAVINHAHFIPIDKAGHLPMLERADEVNSALLNFLSEDQ